MHQSMWLLSRVCQEEEFGKSNSEYKKYHVQNLMSMKEQDMSVGGLLGHELERLSRDLVMLRSVALTLLQVHSLLAEENVACPRESSCSLSHEIDCRPVHPLCLLEVRKVGDVGTCRSIQLQ